MLVLCEGDLPVTAARNQFIVDEFGVVVRCDRCGAVISQVMGESDADWKDRMTAWCKSHRCIRISAIAARCFDCGSLIGRGPLEPADAWDRRRAKWASSHQCKKGR